MPSLRPVLWFVVTFGLMVPKGLSAAVPSMDMLLPKTTVGFVSATNSIRLTEQWNKTQLGKLMTNPVMKPFEEDLRTQLQSQWSGLADRLGIHLDDLRGVSTGESSLALLEPQPGTAATSLLLDVTGNLGKAQALLAKARAGLKARGASEGVQTIRGIPIYVYDVPLPQGQQVAAGRGGVVAAAATGQTIYFLTENLFGASDDLAVVQEILTRLANGSQDGSLSQVAGYRMVMKRCAADALDQVPCIRWYIYPLGYAEATRAATPPEKRRKGKTIIEIMRNQGYAAFKAVGGYVDVSADGFQIVHRTSVFAPPPYTESMKMFVFPNGKDFTPQSWVGRDVATYFTAYVDIQNAFDNFGPLYDEIIGEKGIWKETLKGMITDPNGPQIDLQKELIANLGQRVTMVADYNLPITTTSERLLWAIETKDDAAVAKALEKCVKNDPTIKKRMIAGHVVWEIVEEEDTGVPQLKVDVPALTLKKDDGKAKSDEKDDDQDKEGHFLPHGAITVAHGQLFIASHIDFLVKTLKPVDANSRLATQPGFQKVWDITFGELGVKAQSSRSFSWTDRAVQPTYELIRQGKMPQSESLLGRTLNSLAAPGKKGAPRQQRIDGSKLPDFGVVGKALGPSTAAMTSEANGWFIKGVLMTK
ncbi:MAG: hypothetical protein ABSG53_19790 [Thermoguttaceae bacterium]